MTENPSNDVQDPAEPKQVDTAVETSEQPEPIEGDGRNGEPLDANRNGVFDSVEQPEPTVVETPAEDDHQG